jgi:hypothetical protein
MRRTRCSILQAVRAMGPEALAQVDLPAAARWLGRTLSAPAEVLNAPANPEKE